MKFQGLEQNYRLLYVKNLFLLFILMSCFSTRETVKNAVPDVNNTKKLIGFYDEETDSFSEKLSIAKDFQGIVYLDVENIKLLKEKLLFIRINFGMNSENPVELPLSYLSKTIAGVEKDVLALSIPSKNFFTVPLDYQLFDYSEGAAAGYNAFHKDVYCRGLRVEQDPTSNFTSCSKGDEICKYTYAKVLDQGLFHEQTSTFIQPSELTVSHDESRTYELNLDPINLRRCLTDDQKVFVKNQELNIGELISLDDESYRFKGAFKAVDPSNWGIQAEARWGKFGIFQQEYSGGKSIELGFKSNLFPRVGKIVNRTNRYYLGSKNRLDKKIVTNFTDTSDASALSDWVDGCNLRVLSEDSLGTNIGSCNVSSDIQIFYKDGSEEVIIYSNAALAQAGQVKLQIVNNIQTNIDVKDFNACFGDGGCSSSSCCHDGRCWDKEKYKNQFCKPANSGKTTGQACATDTECLSACCIGSETGAAGVCADKTTSCQRQVGEICIHSDACVGESGDDTYWVRKLLFQGSDGCKVFNCNVLSKPSCQNQRCTSSINEANKVFTFENPLIDGSCQNRVDRNDCLSEVIFPSTETENCIRAADSEAVIEEAQKGCLGEE